MRALFLVFASALAVAASTSRAADGEVSEKVIQAWKEAGAEVRWVATSGLWDDKPTPGCRVGFRFHGWLPGRFDPLPMPEAAFHLEVSFPWPGDESAGVAKEITDAGLKELVRFQKLQALDVFGKEVSDAGAAEIARLKALEQLDLSCTKVTATGLKQLAKLETIKRLSLGQMDVTDEMLREVRGFKHLTRFDLSFNKSEVTVAGAGHLAAIEKLEELSFFGVQVSDAGAKELGRSKGLKEVDFLNTKVTQVGADELRKLLPKCAVSARTVDLTLPGPPLLPQE